MALVTLVGRWRTGSLRQLKLGQHHEQHDGRGVSSGSSSGSASGSTAGGGATSARRAQLVSCLKSHGVTLPERPAGAGLLRRRRRQR